jgi:tetratricopeptide (TPR) repeat protein
MRMDWLFRSRPQTVGALLALVTMALVGFAPLFAGPGYESSLAAGLLLPPLAAVAAALDQARRRAEPFEALSRGAASGTVFALVGFAVTLVHGLRAGFCDVGGGTVTYFLGPFVGAVMGGAWGSFAGEVAGHPRRPGWQRRALAIALGLLGPLLGIVTSLWRIYSTPVIFAFDPFFGFFSGALYDTVVDATAPLLTYRLGSALTLVAAAILCAHLVRNDDGRLALRNLHRAGISLLGAVCATASLMLVLEGHRLGHWQTAATIESELGARLSGARCDVVYSRALGEADVRIFARDCDEQINAVERYFEVRDTGRVTAYLFRNGAEKRRLMGALHTSIAKPWRREVYLQFSGYPHPILAHEIAHVVAGSFAPAPLRVAGGWHGLRPNPGLIEGVAVAASPDEDQLTPSQWSRAMLELGILPSPDTISSFGFFGKSAATAYTAAGAFVAFIRERHGALAVRRWYGGEDLAAITRVPPFELRERFKDHLRKEPLPDVARAIAKARFDRPSVWGRQCPHDVDRYRFAAAGAQEQGDHIEAARTYHRLLDLDPRDDEAKLGIAQCSLRRNQQRHAKTVLADLADDDRVSRPVRDRALTLLADLAMQEADYDRAAERYATLQSRTLDEDTLRALEVKMNALGDPRARRALSALFVGSADRGVDLPTATALLGAWIGEDPTDGLPEYLLGRDLAARGFHREAAERFDRALAKRLSAGRVLREALRQRVIAACALADTASAKRAYDIWADKGGETVSTRRHALRQLVERCTGEAVPE